MSKLAFQFPGQASQYAGMGKDLAENYDVARKLFERADRALGFSISGLCFEGPEDALKLTENTQPAILAVSVAALLVLGEHGVVPDIVAGHSLGEYSALVASGGLSFEDAIRLVQRRGQYMQDAVPTGEGSMAAIMGLAPTLVTDICRKAADGEVVSPANLNSPDQTVISGAAAAVKRAVELASQNGAKRAVILPVSAPFHCAMMMPAQLRLGKDLEAVEFASLRCPLVTNVDADTITDGAEARDALIRQVSLPVRWGDSIREILDAGATTVVEVGPGRVLSGILRQIDRSVHSLNVQDKVSLENTLEKINQSRSEMGEN
jgi:[acyl-carrier-protein] S-malonyltransferase